MRFDFNPEVGFDGFCEELEETFGIGRGKIRHVHYGFEKRPTCGVSIQ